MEMLVGVVGESKEVVFITKPNLGFTKGFVGLIATPVGESRFPWVGWVIIVKTGGTGEAELEEGTTWVVLPEDCIFSSVGGRVIGKN